jgi:hypothetical protein
MSREAAKTEEHGLTPVKNGSSGESPASKKSIGRITTEFIAEVDSLAETLPLATASINRARKQARDGFQAFLQTLPKEAEAAGRLTFTVPPDDSHKFSALRRRIARSEAAAALVPRSFLVALVSQYDAFLGRLIHALLLLRPEILNGSERALSFADLLAFGTVEAARDHIIEKEVEAVLRKSHTEQFDWLENKFNIKLHENLPVWPTFVEVTERRNLCVHTGAKVSAQYLQNCKSHQVDVTNVAVGAVLPVSRAYFRAAYTAIFEIGVKLAHVLWRKLNPADRPHADANLNSITFDLLVDEKYELAKTLLDFATETLKNHASANHRLPLVVNRIQAYKWSGDENTARKLLDKEDFSALDNRFKLAKLVLLDDVWGSLNLMRKMGRDGGVSLGAYRDWPLFRKLRALPEFGDAVFEIFGERLSAPVEPEISVTEAESQSHDSEEGTAAAEDLSS